MRNKMMKAVVVMGLAGLMVAAAPAKAADFALTIDIEGRNGNHFGLTIGKGYVTPVVAVQPVVPVVVQPVERIWVPPVYRDVIERVWVPTTEIRYRDVPVVDAWGNVIAYRREAYTVQTGYWQDVARRELVREGYWQTAYPGGSQKRYYGMNEKDGCERGEVKIGLMLEKDRHQKNEMKRGIMIEQAAAEKGPMKAGLKVAQGPAPKELANGKLLKVGAVKK